MSMNDYGGGFTMPSWMEVDERDPDLATLVLYLECGEQVSAIAPLLQLWHDEACRLLLPFVQPAGATAPTTSFTAFDEPAAGRGRRRRPCSWSDGLTEGLGQLSAHWYDVAPGAAELDLHVLRFAGGRHLKLQASVGFAERSAQVPRVLSALIELIRRMAHAADLTYGEILRAAGNATPATLLDAALRRAGDESAEASRTFLRGYEWLTVCPRELAHRLGGAEGLAASGAFAEVRPLPHGAVLLRATDSPEEYRGERVHAVFAALAPVLPGGQPRGLPEHDFTRIVFTDARHAATAAAAPRVVARASCPVVPAPREPAQAPVDQGLVHTV
ncbi:hypothetical protein SAMN05444365_101155 [Micromonospora pattaloongensis]|uniref:Uncharacterized protein n=1 Tax=Micromonospora pattaloongensis TaxID=405436 RepID=A0A1H3FTX5_9ACTN|nr:hypothetical protein [Micromonospora pattaloongensis]SDX94265.1 hypothetical protein SAMN05444365_101155 [Micromonospora pattaloongensis]